MFPINPQVLQSMFGMVATPQSPAEAPPRILVALSLLRHLTDKTSDRGMVWDGGSETLEGQQLTTAEANVQATACNVLNDYLRGKMEPDWYEKVHLDRKEGGLIGVCPICNGEPREEGFSCRGCKGVGKVILFPVR